MPESDNNIIIRDDKNILNVNFWHLNTKKMNWKAPVEKNMWKLNHSVFESIRKTDELLQKYFQGGFYTFVNLFSNRKIFKILTFLWKNSANAHKHKTAKAKGYRREKLKKQRKLLDYFLKKFEKNKAFA